MKRVNFVETQCKYVFLCAAYGVINDDDDDNTNDLGVPLCKLETKLPLHLTFTAAVCDCAQFNTRRFCCVIVTVFRNH